MDGDVAIVEISGLLLQRAIYLCGFEVVSGYDSIGNRLKAAFDDERVAGVLPIFDSPGGECAGCAELATAIVEWSTASGKPVESYAGEMAASAAYWLASSAGGITVPRTGRVGSIGTVAVNYNVSGEMAAKGRRAIVSASPMGKALGHRAILTAANEDVDAAFRGRMDQLTRELTSIFAGHVAERRGMSVDDVMALDADMFLGSSAVEKRLADRVGNRSAALAAVRSRMKKREYSMAEQTPAQRAGASLLGVLKAGGFSRATTEAPPEEIEAASKEATRLAELGRSVEGLTGAKGGASLEMVRTWRDGHVRIRGLENRVMVERLRGRDAMKVPPAAAFGVLPPDAKGADGKPHPMAGLPHPDAGPHADYAAMSLDVFDARLDAALLHPAASKAPSPSPMTSTGLTADEEKLCKSRGIDPAAYAKHKARVLGEEVVTSG